MSVTVTDAWKAAILLAIEGIDHGPQPDIEMGLFTNSHTPAPTDVIGDYDEVTLPGYARQGFDALVWTPDSTSDTVTTKSTAAIYLNDPYVGTPTIALGYFLFDQNAGELVGAETFAVPYTFPLIGGALSMQVTLGVNQLPLP